MLQLLIRRRARHQQSILVAHRQPPNQSRTGNASGYDWDDVSKFGLEDGEEVCRAVDGDEAVGVCELGKDADFGGVFELAADGHCWERGEGAG